MRTEILTALESTEPSAVPYELLRRYRDHDDGLHPRPKRPNFSPNATPDAMRARILELRTTLTRNGWDASAETIHDHLTREHPKPPSVTTIWRILKSAGTITPQPQKRPTSSPQRFEAAQPNETWQSDFTRWHLADGSDVEIISWLDDHSRPLLHCTAHSRITTPIVTSSFTTTATEHGLPAATLTDNGMVYTTRFARGQGGPNHLETLLRQLGITQKNSAPNHPQTQGKIERFHQTLKRHRATRRPAHNLHELNTQLDTFRDYYNEQRPHRALNRRTPGATYRTLPRATPNPTSLAAHYRVRTDTVDGSGTVTLRYQSRHHHLAIGRRHKGTKVLILIHDRDTIVTNPTTGEILAQHTINPNRDYQPKNKNPPPEGGE